MSLGRSVIEAINRSKRGISPVVATVILVAVAVVIAAALAGFSGSLFGTYSGAPTIMIKEMIIDANGDGSMTMMNNGASADSVVSIQVQPNPAATSQGSDSPSIEANSEAIITFAGLGTFTPGQHVTAQIKMKSGMQMTRNVIIDNPTITESSSLPPPCNREPPKHLVPFC